MAVVEGRQAGTKLKDIRADHQQRYRMVATQPWKTVIDVGCGVGYGSWLMAKAGMNVLAVDRSATAVKTGLEHYNHERITYVARPVEEVMFMLNQYDAAVAFEIIEHLAHPAEALSRLRNYCHTLIGSVPNQDVIPYDANKHTYHHRHYRPVEIENLLKECGWRVTNWWTQTDKVGDGAILRPGQNGRTVIFAATR